jgi:glycosyltransferase involved in cell wall biosynthesis
VAVVTPAFKEYLVEHWHVAPGKIAIVQNGVDTDLFSPQETNGDLTRELATEGKFVVSYIGTLGLAHALDTLLEAAARLRDSHPEVLFLLVGEGSDKERLVSLARSQRLSNLRFVDQQPREKIPAYICASHACLVLLKKADVFKTVIPTKMLEFMACARPVILGVDGQARKIIEDAQAGLFVEPQSADELAQAITLLAGNPSLRESFGRNGRRHILSRYSRRQTADVYIEVLDELVGNNRRRRKLAA